MTKTKFSVAARATLLMAICAASGTVDAAGAYSQPYALFEPQAQMEVADTRPAFILKVDGRDVAIDTAEPVAPGKHELVVSIPGTTRMSNPTRATLTIDAKPCTRYYLAARRSSPTARDWSAFVGGSEPIGECVRRFQK